MPDEDSSAIRDPEERRGASHDEVVQLRHEVAGLIKAIESRDVIGQAKGILMERQRVSSDEAFDALRRASQDSNVKVVDIARLLAETGEWPVDGTGSA